MARLILLLLFMALVISGSLALKSCSERSPPSSVPANADGSALVALRDGSTMMASPGTVGRELVDWLASRKAGSKAFELGGQEFVGRSAVLTSESIGRVGRLVAMLRANPDVRITIIGHADASGEADADRVLGLERAQVLASLLREGGVADGRIRAETRGATEPIAPNDSAPHRDRNQRVSLILSRSD